MDAVTRERVVQDLQNLLANEHGLHLFAVLDAARSGSVYALLEDSKVRRSSLLEQRTTEELRRASPYLVDVRPGAPLLDRFLESGWGQAWGVLLTSSYEHDFLIDHLRSIVHARTPEGGRYFFRFYDPRVLRVYLPTCTPRELGDFFGPIERFLVEGEQAKGEVVEYGMRDGALAQRAFGVPRP